MRRGKRAAPASSVTAEWFSILAAQQNYFRAFSNMPTPRPRPRPIKSGGEDLCGFLSSLGDSNTQPGLTTRRVYKSYPKKTRGTFSVLSSPSPNSIPCLPSSNRNLPSRVFLSSGSPNVLQPRKHLSLPHFPTAYPLATASFLSNLQFLGPGHNKHFLWHIVPRSPQKVAPLSNLVRGGTTQKEGEAKP